MPFNDEIVNLCKKADEVGDILQRNWLYQVVVSAIGFLYLVEPLKAADVVNKFNIPPSSIQLGVPLVGGYLFTRFGYALALFLLNRRALLQRIPAGEDHEFVFAATMNYSMFWFLSALANPQEATHMSGLRRKLGGEGRVPRPRSFLPNIGMIFPAVRLLSFLPSVGIILLAVGTYLFNNALVIYFIFDLEFIEEWSKTERLLLALGTGGFVLTALYRQFWGALWAIYSKKTLLVWACWGIAAVTTAGLILWDPNPQFPVVSK